jgi:hypothetical protein
MAANDVRVFKRMFLEFGEDVGCGRLAQRVVNKLVGSSALQSKKSPTPRTTSWFRQAMER